MNLSISLQRHGANRFLGTQKNLHSKQTKLFRATRQAFRRSSDCAVSSLASLAAPMWLMHTQCWSAGHLVVLNHALAPPDSPRSCDASVSISSVVETSLKLSCGLSPAQSTLSRERFSPVARLRRSAMSVLRSLLRVNRTYRGQPISVANDPFRASGRAI
jgi:hypothetical protein